MSQILIFLIIALSISLVLYISYNLNKKQILKSKKENSSEEENIILMKTEEKIEESKTKIENDIEKTLSKIPKIPKKESKEEKPVDEETLLDEITLEDLDIFTEEEPVVVENMEEVYENEELNEVKSIFNSRIPKKAEEFPEEYDPDLYILENEIALANIKRYTRKKSSNKLESKKQKEAVKKGKRYTRKKQKKSDAKPKKRYTRKKVKIEPVKEKEVSDKPKLKRGRPKKKDIPKRGRPKKVVTPKRGRPKKKDVPKRGRPKKNK